MAFLAVLAGLMAAAPAQARSGHHGFATHGHHGLGHGAALHGGNTFAGGQRHDNDVYVNAASQEQDRLLDTRIKNICRGC